uniref:Uncharacterized protein n=1 Tax=Mycena chlorophos TaxID=658473 RepID=A0ABQ0MB47_MYCCL|nr:predicted protein [Mycena chlorophos]
MCSTGITKDGEAGRARTDYIGPRGQTRAATLDTDTEVGGPLSTLAEERSWFVGGRRNADEEEDGASFPTPP